MDVVLTTEKKKRTIAWIEKLMDGSVREIYEGEEKKHLRRFELQAEHYGESWRRL